MKNAKQTKASKRVDDGVDIVSNLPDPILHLILSCLPTTEEVIRTSILSRRWRYLWTAIPRLDIDYSRGLSYVETFNWNKLREDKFIEFMDWVLLNKPFDLDSFHLRCSSYYSMSTVGRWIHAAVTRNVKLLHLVFRPRIFSVIPENIEMPHCLVTCVSLEVLKLFLLRGGLSLPNYTGFPSLRVLELNGGELFDANLVKSFFRSCPLLEDLSLIDMGTLEFLCISCLKLKNLRIDNRDAVKHREHYVCGDLQISCPKLVFLELTGHIANSISVCSLDSLKKAVIHIHPGILDSDRLDDSVRELFAGISHVESLSLNHFFTYKCIDPKVDVPVSIPKLKTLELTIGGDLLMHVYQFLKFRPDLESLHLNIILDYFKRKCWKLNDAATIRILTRQLKKVEYFNFNGKDWQLDIARFFLEHGDALEEMVFNWGDKAKFHKRSIETMNQVSKFYKASSSVKLVALQKRWIDG